MNIYSFLVSRFVKIMRLTIFLMVFFARQIFAHPSPNSILLLNIKENGVAIELQLPLSELELAFGKNLTTSPEKSIKMYEAEIRAYILAHLKPTTIDGKIWGINAGDIEVKELQQVEGKYYQDMVVKLFMIPPKGADNRVFNLNYDGILHQVSSHSILVKINNDWQNGVSTHNPVEVGMISLDIVNNKIPVFAINQKKGSIWQGFKSMVTLGMSHIKDGTDHLLFLLVLLLPALQIVQNKRWAGFRGTKESFFKIIKIVTSFTVGHSITLLLGAIGFINFPSKPIEILIAVSIMVSAVHAIRPIFNNKEIFIAAGFGLIHGLAFANTLKELGLATSHFVLSIFGFNLGVEIFQIFIVILVFPILLLLAQKTTKYSLFRTTGAVIAIFASFYWLWERV